MKDVLTFLLTFFSFTMLMAQTGQYDIRLVQEHPFQCGDEVIYFDIQVKASTAGATFRLAEQNYRFEYDTLILTNPRIDQELDLSGVVDDGTQISVYKAHTLGGTLGDIVSYNVILGSGDGYLLTDTWMPVGRIAFDIIYSIGCVDFTWHTATDFPVTYIGETYNDLLVEVNEGAYMGFFGCLSSICLTCPPSLNLPYILPDNTYSAVINITSDGTVPTGGDVEYQAGDVIMLDSGFSVLPQADFSAEISACN